MHDETAQEIIDAKCPGHEGSITVKEMACVTCLQANFAAALTEAENSVEPWQEAACENGHHDHAECSEACSCWGAGNSRIEKAEQEAERLRHLDRLSIAWKAYAAETEARGRAAGLELAARYVDDVWSNTSELPTGEGIRALI